MTKTNYYLVIQMIFIIQSFVIVFNCIIKGVTRKKVCSMNLSWLKWSEIAMGLNRNRREASEEEEGGGLRRKGGGVRRRIHLIKKKEKKGCKQH